MRNILATAHAGLLFVLPGRDETLRVNGRAFLTTDPDILDRFSADVRRPKVAIGVEIDELSAGGGGLASLRARRKA